MTDLFEKSIETLELPRVLDLLADQAVTQEGKERARRLRPETDLEEVAQRLKETTAAVDRMVLRGSPSFSGVKPVAGSLQRADMGGQPQHPGAAGHRRRPGRRPVCQGLRGE